MNYSHVDCMHRSSDPAMEEPSGVVYCVTKICSAELSDVSSHF